MQEDPVSKPGGGTVKLNFVNIHHLRVDPLFKLRVCSSFRFVFLITLMALLINSALAARATGSHTGFSTFDGFVYRRLTN